MESAKSSPLFFIAALIFFMISTLWTFGLGSGFFGILCAVLGVLFFGLGLIKAGQETKLKQKQIDEVQTDRDQKNA